MPWKWIDVAGREIVGEHDLDLVADFDLNLRSRYDPVVRPRLHDHAGLDLPVGDRRRELEALRAVRQDLGRQRLAAHLALDGRVQERHRPFVHRRLHVLPRGVAVEVVGGRRGLVRRMVGSGGAGGRAADRQGAGHPGRRVSGDLAVHVVRAGTEDAEIEHLRFALLEILGLLPGDRQVVDLGVAVGDANLDVARCRRQLIRSELERTELDIEHRQRRAGSRADGIVLVEDRDEERDHERSDRDEERGPTQYGAVF